MNDCFRLMTAAALATGLAFSGAAFAQTDETLPEEEQLMVDPAFSDDPEAQVPAEPSAAERAAEVAADRGPATSRGDIAVLRGLDKVTGQTRDLQVAAGEHVQFGRLDVMVAECRFPAANPAADAYAQMTITDQRANQVVFSGWMIASSPALSALDDSRYDIWTVSCNKA